MRAFQGFSLQSRRLALLAMLVPAAFGIALLVLELGSIVAASAA